jgi:16S rRNA C967 or C1407 C5-methylase (RsmB/RsmF family)
MEYTPKPQFIERMKLLLKDKEDLDKFLEYSKTRPKKSIRVNTLKISPSELKSRLEKNYNWEIKQISKDNPEIFQIVSNLQPGEIGKTKEHLLGYYYVQEITSMMPIIALDPKPQDIFLDLCASPGSKTTQAGAKMKNTGTIIANDVSIPRIVILSSNLEKNGVTNAILTRHDGIELAQKLKKLASQFESVSDSQTENNDEDISGWRKGDGGRVFQFNKILVDAPCSGEGNIRISPRTYLEWSEGLLERFGKRQMRLAEEAFKILSIGGVMVYSTCTHSPEENEDVVQYLLDTFKDQIEILPVSLPIKSRPGILSWKNKKFSKELTKAARIYHHDNDMEGFFLCKMKKIK